LPGDFVQGNQDIGGQPIKFFWIRLVVQQAGEGCIAKIFQQQEPAFIGPGQNGRHAETELMEVLVDMDKRCNACQSL
jgi:hypothetical protein